MKTTAIFVELLIVGIMTVLLFILAMNLAAGPQWVLVFLTIIKEANLVTTALALALVYVIGIIADELYDSLTRPLENCVINRTLKDNSSKAWELQAQAMLNSPEAATGIEYMRGRIRILRSTIVVFPVATVLESSAVLFQGSILGFEKIGSFIFIFPLGCILSVGAFFAYYHLMDNYWRRVLALSHEKQNGSSNNAFTVDG